MNADEPDNDQAEDEADELNFCRECGRRAPGRRCFECGGGVGHGRRETLPPGYQDNPTPLS